MTETTYTSTLSSSRALKIVFLFSVMSKLASDLPNRLCIKTDNENELINLI